MLDSVRVTVLRLRLADQQRDLLVLDPGVHALAPSMLGGPSSTVEPLGHVYVDSRGVWLQVRDGLRGVHVNGRPVRHMALLRAGDALFLQGTECLLLGREPGIESAPVRRGAAASRCVLRATGGPLHGRCFPLDEARTLGGDAAADIRIPDDPAVAGLHLELRRVDGGIALLVDGGAAPVAVNGHRVTEAVLRPGDQVVVGGQHRFVLEAPRASMETDDADAPAPEAAAVRRAPPVRRSVRRIPWLLLAALLLAGALSLLLLYGAA